MREKRTRFFISALGQHAVHFKRVLIASSVVKCRLILSVCALIILAMPFAFKTIIEFK